MELYIHIPFCVRKCGYCDFLSAPADARTMDWYVGSIEKQLAGQAAFFSAHAVDTVFIGGGTPTALSAPQLSALLSAVRMYVRFSDGAEFTVEANPGTVTGEKARILAEGGVNRASLGLQSADERELRLLGRIHTYEDFLRSYEALRIAGIANINVDVMSALPGQTVSSYEKTLRAALALHPAHISAYSLIIEEGTPFFERYHEDERIRDAGGNPRFLPGEEEERRMYCLTGELLDGYGLARYEISNYARPGYECRHNIGYWTGEPYLGIGLGASSYIDGTRYRCTDRLEEYIAGDFNPRDEQRLSREDMMAEFFILGLRMTRGVEKAEFVRRFGIRAEQAYGGTLSGLVSEGLLEDTGTGYRLTPYGRDVSNQVFWRFL